MTVDIKQFLATVTKLGGVAKANRGLATFTLPAAVNAGDASKTLTFMCETQVMPGITVGTTDRSVPYGYGPAFKMPWGVVFSDINLMFYCDSQGLVHNTLIKWLHSVVNFNTSKGMYTATDGMYPFLVNYREKYITTLKLSLWDERNQTILTYTLLEAYPTLLDDMRTAWSTQNQPLYVGARFSYTRWHSTYHKLGASEAGTISSLNQAAQMAADARASGSTISATQADSLASQYNSVIDTLITPVAKEYASSIAPWLDASGTTGI